MPINLNTSKVIDVALSRGGDEFVDVRFRRARAEDAEAMYRLSLPFMDTGQLLVRERALFETLSEDFRVLEADGEVVGCAGLRGFDTLAEIYNVAVDENRHGLGLGRLLLASMVGAAHAEGYPQVLVFSKTTSAWFARYGFRPVDSAGLPAARLALVDPARESVALGRATVGGYDGVEVLAALTELRITFDRSSAEFGWDGSYDSLLPFADDNGVETKSLCWAGVCGTCAVRLKRGTVRYHVPPQGDPDEGEVLLCISQPVTDLVLDL
ncbi:MAG: GNAT family N-acetyltransferase [Streptomyces sp.]|nr:GNAT family N-acetyltransferase [Streptomyces sp.]NUR64214.1 GNAT family N-acetyltransferase [Streptomyces sp.]NUS30949.1 GNAT family N-acetyltransferase [Streptomyces sp.]